MRTDSAFCVLTFSENRPIRDASTRWQTYVDRSEALDVGAHAREEAIDKLLYCAEKKKKKVSR